MYPIHFSAGLVLHTEALTGRRHARSIREPKPSRTQRDTVLNIQTDRRAPSLRSMAASSPLLSTAAACLARRFFAAVSSFSGYSSRTKKLSLPASSRAACGTTSGGACGTEMTQSVTSSVREARWKNATSAYGPMPAAQNRTLRPYLTAIHRNLIPAMPGGGRTPPPRTARCPPRTTALVESTRRAHGAA
jgi:hypothetical protein